MQLVSYKDSKLALGSRCTLVLCGPFNQNQANHIFDALWLSIYRFERRFSRFLPESELTHINQQAGKWTRISSHMHSILARSLELSKATHGCHNPFILPALIRAGYASNSLKSYKQDELPHNKGTRVAHPQEMKLEDTRVYIPEDTALDLGGLGKGFLADILASEPTIKQQKGFWFSIGGDIAGGGQDELREPWKLRIQNAHDNEHTLAITTELNHDFHIATSGTITRRWTDDKGRAWHHIIDPQTEKPVSSDVLLATVASNSTALSDVLATTAIILGAEKALTKLRSMGAESVLLQSVSGQRVGYGFLAEQEARPLKKHYGKYHYEKN